MAIDPARAIFVSKPYRYVERSNATIREKFSGATEIVIETNLDEAAATKFANALFASVSSGNVSAFTFTIEGLIYPEDFTISPPRYTLAFDRHPVTAGVTYTVTSAKPDYSAGQTTITVRGA